MQYAFGCVTILKAILKARGILEGRSSGKQVLLTGLIPQHTKPGQRTKPQGPFRVTLSYS